jgi:hypothetical protein
MKSPQKPFLNAALFSLLWFGTGIGGAVAAADSHPQRYVWSVRASEVDPRVRAHPEIDFPLEKGGKPADLEHASVDTRVPCAGRLVIWLMSHPPALFERLNSYGMHAIQVHYANGWFSKFNQEPPPADTQHLGRIRLEAATGEDFSPLVEIPKPDGMMERAYQFVKWLALKNPEGGWGEYIAPDGKGLLWEKVIVSGASHGATTAARFGIHQKVGRVVMFCGPRDQYEDWQSLESATPANRFFGFSHVLDGGWVGGHYPRSWQMLGLQRFGPVVNVDNAVAPFGHSRRMITDADVSNDANRAHSGVVPGGASAKDASGGFLHEEVWRYLFTSAVDEAGASVAPDPSVRMQQRPSASAAPRVR